MRDSLREREKERRRMMMMIARDESTIIIIRMLLLVIFVQDVFSFSLLSLLSSNSYRNFIWTIFHPYLSVLLSSILTDSSSSSFFIIPVKELEDTSVSFSVCENHFFWNRVRKLSWNYGRRFLPLSLPLFSLYSFGFTSLRARKVDEEGKGRKSILIMTQPRRLFRPDVDDFANLKSVKFLKAWILKLICQRKITLDGWQGWKSCLWTDDYRETFKKVTTIFTLFFQRLFSLLSSLFLTFLSFISS